MFGGYEKDGGLREAKGGSRTEGTREHAVSVVFHLKAVIFLLFSSSSSSLCKLRGTWSWDRDNYRPGPEGAEVDKAPTATIRVLNGKELHSLTHQKVI